MKYLKLRDFAILTLLVGFAFAMGGCTPPAPEPEPEGEEPEAPAPRVK